MKSFKFALQNILELKRKLEDNEKNKLLKLKSELNLLLDEMAALNTLYENTKRKHKEQSSAGVAPPRFAEMVLYIKEIDKKIALKHSEIDGMQEKIEIQANVLKEANKEVKMLEKLREKQLAVYERAVLKEDELIIDDFIAGKSLIN